MNCDTGVFILTYLSTGLFMIAFWLWITHDQKDININQLQKELRK